jgi:hypothetical protein
MSMSAAFTRGLVLLAVSATVLLGGCAQTATYNAAYLTPPATAAGDKLAGKVLVYTVKVDDDTVWSGKPTSLTGGATTLNIPLGLIAREIAAVVLGDAFRDGAVKSNALDGAAAYRVIVQPRVTGFSYEYNGLKNAGFAITPTALLTLEVTLLDAGGKTLAQRRYDSGTVEAPVYFVSGSPGEEIGKATHKALFDLMVKATRDLHDTLRLRADGPLAL